MNIKNWSTLGRLRTLWLKMISLKGVSFVVVLAGVGLGRIDAVAGLAFIGAMLGLREYTKVKMNGFASAPKIGVVVVEPEGGEA